MRLFNRHYHELKLMPGETQTIKTGFRTYTKIHAVTEVELKISESFNDVTFRASHEIGKQFYGLGSMFAEPERIKRRDLKTQMEIKVEPNKSIKKEKK